MTEQRRKYKLVVSDFHLGKGRFFRDGTQNILEDFIYDREFAEFLNYYRSGDFAEADVELILNGDILNLLQIDTWGVHTHLFTERSVVRAIGKIVAGHPQFFEALRRFAAAPHHSISYIPGNHDVGMLWPGPRKAFCEAIGAEVTFHDIMYRFDGIHVEHGHQYEWFSGIDMKRPFITHGLPEPVLSLPWASHFVAVLLPKIKQQQPHVDKVKPFAFFMRWTFFHDFWWSFKTCLGIAKFIVDTLFFKSRYQIHQGIRATFGLLKEISIYPDFDKFAFKILKENEAINTVIFGHTHQVGYRQWREGKEYFNEGTWNEVTNLELRGMGTQIRLIYAFVEYPPPVADEANVVEPGVQRPKVRLKQWKGIWRPEIDVLA